jgi:hypothetical protein
MCKVLKCLDKTSQDNDLLLAGDTHSFGDYLSDHQSFMSIGVELIGGENRAWGGSASGDVSKISILRKIQHKKDPNSSLVKNSKIK